MSIHALVRTADGTAFAGLLTEACEQPEWIAVKPSSKSDVTVYFNKSCVCSVLYEDGRQTDYAPALRNCAFEETEIPEKNVIMVRVKGGVSYRGSSVQPVSKDRESGYWLIPCTGSGIVIFIPEVETERVFVL